MTLPKNTRSTLLGAKWDIQDPDGDVTLIQAKAIPLGRAIDEEWGPDRKAAWSWHDALLAGGRYDGFAIVSGRGEVLALLSSLKTRPLDPPHGPTYRVDFFEVSPRLVGTGWGYFPFAIAAASRALEVRAENIVLAAVPGSEKAYERYGGVPLSKRECSAYNWKADSRLLPYHFSFDVLTDLHQDANAWKKP